MRSKLTLARILLGALALLVSAVVSAHEIRPAYLQITENDRHGFDVLWKQPALENLALRLEPEVSN